MSWTPPKVSEPDSEGFRTFSFFAPDVGEIIRISFNVDRQREYLARTASDQQQYSPTELKGLKLAARIIAARDSFPGHDREAALEGVFNLTPEFISKTLEKYFPSLALLAIRAALDVCVKHTLNIAVKSCGAPNVYDDVMLQEILRHFTSVARGFLEIKPGRPLQTEVHLNETTQALEQLEKKGTIQRGTGLPTQELVSSRLGISPRSLRDWCRACRLTWREFLRACGWPIEPEGN